MFTCISVSELLGICALIFRNLPYPQKFLATRLILRTNLSDLIETYYQSLFAWLVQ